MELTYFYKAEMPNCQDWTLDISKLNISLIWDRTVQTTIKMYLMSVFSPVNPIYLAWEYDALRDAWRAV